MTNNNNQSSIKKEEMTKMKINYISKHPPSPFLSLSLPPRSSAFAFAFLLSPLSFSFPLHPFSLLD
jgi:hypothetical protein